MLAACLLKAVGIYFAFLNLQAAQWLYHALFRFFLFLIWLLEDLFMMISTDRCLIRAGIIFIGLLFFISCDIRLSGDDDQPLSPEPDAQILPSGVTLTGILGSDFFVHALFKGPGNPGPDGTVGPPENVPGPGEMDEGDIPGENAPTDGTSGPPDGSAGPADGTAGPPDGAAGPPDGTPGPSGSTSDSPDTGSGGGPGPAGARGGGTLSSAFISQYPLLVVLEGTTFYGVPDIFGYFQIQSCPEGDHALVLYNYGKVMAKKYIRVNAHDDLTLGEIAGIDDEGFLICSGFDGYRFPWKDEDENGINDIFKDADGDGRCDLTGQAYAHGYGWRDDDGDGIHDHFIDADGDGRNDLLNQAGYGFTFGFIDQDDDGLNDFLRDYNGDGINDLNDMPYAHGFGWQDEDGDGINDRFTDADGDGVNEVTGNPVAHGYMFGFVDIDQDGVNDNFADSDGDGICDQGKLSEGIPYAHGFGWQDEDGDGINDRFTDADGDGINDMTGLAYSYGRNKYGFSDVNEDGIIDYFPDRDDDGMNDKFVDADGDGFNDLGEGDPIRHGFGWQDEDGDGINDNFTDENGDGVNDLNGIPYGK